jgi:hypothetical protein
MNEQECGDYAAGRYPYVYLKGEGFETMFAGPDRADKYKSKEAYPGE